jgi:hypothetical protein
MTAIVSVIGAVASSIVLVLCGPNPTASQTWSCSKGSTGYTWLEDSGNMRVTDGDARMYYFAASHDPTVKLESTRVC